MAVLLHPSCILESTERALKIPDVQAMLVTNKNRIYRGGMCTKD